MRRALLALALVLPSCGVLGGGDEQPPVELAATEAVATWGYTPVPGGVHVLATLPVRVREEVTFTAVTVEMAAGDLEVLDVRLLPGDYPGGGGAGCSRTTWPPRGYGVSVPLTTPVRAGTETSFAIYFRPRGDRATSAAYVVTYRTGHGETRTLRRTNERIVVEPPKPGNPSGCPGTRYIDPAA